MTIESGRAKTSVELSPARSSRESCRASSAREEVGENKGRSAGSRMYTTILRCEREATSMLVPAKVSISRNGEMESECDAHIDLRNVPEGVKSVPTAQLASPSG